MKRKIMLTVLVVILLVSAVWAEAATTSVVKNIKASFQNIKIYVDGEKITPSVEPFIVQEEGVTMVPLRDIAEALGREVAWDGANGIIKIGAVDSDFPTEAESRSYDWIEDLTVVRNVGPFYQQPGRNFLIAAGAHSHGIAVEISDEEGYSEAEVTLRTGGQYQAIEGWIGVEDVTMNSSGAYVLTIYADNNKIYQSRSVLPGMYPKFISKSMTGISSALTVRVHVQWLASGQEGDYSNLVAALADLKFIKKT